MKKLLRNISSNLILVISLLLMVSPAIASDPMDDVFSLLDSGGGSRSGTNKVDGYYVVAMGTSSRSSEAKGYEEARIDALRQLTEIINGVTMSGSTSSSMKYITVSEGNSNSEFSKESFIDVVNMSFKGQLSAAKMLKQGQYDGDYFVAMSISETDIKNVSKLQATTSNQSNNGGNTIIISTDAGNHSVAEFNKASSSVEAKGIASIKNGQQQARQQALQDALRNAVQQAQGVMLQGKSGTFNSALSMAISTKTEGYVSSYEILDEEIDAGNYIIIIMAEVNASKLLNDVNFYLNVLGQPVFSVASANKSKSAWITDELERLGFTINDGKTTPTHTFSLKQSQREIEDYKGSKGTETALTVTLKDNYTGDILFTVINESIKTRIYVKPVSRAKQVSEHVAYKQMKKKLGIEVIQSLARNAEKGTVYQIVLKNAKRTDANIFKLVLNNGTAGSVVSWDWDKTGKKITLHYRFSGPLSEAFDQGLDEIYNTFKKEGKGRRPHMEKTDKRSAHFDMVRS